MGDLRVAVMTVSEIDSAVKATSSSSSWDGMRRSARLRARLGDPFSALPTST